MPKQMMREMLELVEARKPELTYTNEYNNKKKEKLERVVVALSGNQSGKYTKMAARYLRMKDAIEVMQKKRDQLNADLKNELTEDLFDAADEILTRVVETAQFTLQLSKQTPKDPKIDVDKDAIIAELEKLISDELKPMIQEITKRFTKLVDQAPTPAALRVSQKKLTEDVDLVAKFKSAWQKLADKLKSWLKSYDAKLRDLKQRAKAL